MTLNNNLFTSFVVGCVSCKVGHGYDNDDYSVIKGFIVGLVVVAMIVVVAIGSNVGLGGGSGWGDGRQAVVGIVSDDGGPRPHNNGRPSLIGQVSTVCN